MKNKHKKKKASKILLGFFIFIISIILIFGISQTFFGEEAILDINSEGLYHYSGEFGKTISSSEQVCLLPQEVILGNYNINNIAIINTINYKYEFVNSEVRSAIINNDTVVSAFSYCSKPYYNTKVYRDEELIDEISFNENTDDCNNINSLNLEKSYDELNVVFGAGFDRRGSDECGGQKVIVVHKYIPLYEDNIINNITITKNSVSSDTAILNLAYENTLDKGLLETNIYLKTILLTKNLLFSNEQQLNKNANSFDFSIPINDEVGELELIIVNKMYLPTTEISNLNGVVIWKNLTTSNEKLVVNQDAYEYYLIKTEEITKKIVIRGEDNSSNINNNTFVNLSLYTSNCWKIKSIYQSFQSDDSVCEEVNILEDKCNANKGYYSTIGECKEAFEEEGFNMDLIWWSLGALLLVILTITSIVLFKNKKK